MEFSSDYTAWDGVIALMAKGMYLGVSLCLSIWQFHFCWGKHGETNESSLGVLNNV